MEDGVAINRAHWDERVAVHLRSAFYNVDGFRRGETDLTPIEAAEIGRASCRERVSCCV